MTDSFKFTYASSTITFLNFLSYHSVGLIPIIPERYFTFDDMIEDYIEIFDIRKDSWILKQILGQTLSYNLIKHMRMEYDDCIVIISHLVEDVIMLFIINKGRLITKYYIEVIDGNICSIPINQNILEAEKEFEIYNDIITRPFTIDDLEIQTQTIQPYINALIIFLGIGNVKYKYVYDRCKEIIQFQTYMKINSDIKFRYN